MDQTTTTYRRGSVLPLIFVLILAGVAAAQTTTANLNGTVTDQSGSAVRGASVRIFNAETGLARDTTTSEAGLYSVPLLPPGTYQVEVRAPGFRTLTRSGVTLSANQSAQVDLALEIGAVSEKVEISASAPIIDQNNSVIRYAIDTRAIAELPLPNANILNALPTVPGVVGEPGSELSSIFLSYVDPGSSFAMSGGRQGTTQYKADGIDNTSLGLNRISTSFTSDAVQEISVQQNSFSAEFGRAAGGVVNIVTKSGSNELHGTLFSYIQNDILNAAPYVRTQSKGLERLWRGGVDVGGPVRIPWLYNGHDRTFFFAAYEPLRESTNITAFTRMPTDLERQGDFSQSVYDAGANNYPVTIYQQFTNTSGALTTVRNFPPVGTPYPAWPQNRIPQSLISPAAEKVLAFLPLPNMALNSAGQNYRFARGVHNVDNRWLFKIDQVLTANNRLSFRYARVPTSGVRSDLFGVGSPAAQTPTDRNSAHNIVLSDTQVWGGNKVNEFRIGLNRFRTDRGFSSGALSANWFEELGFPSVLQQGFPHITIGNNVWGPGVNFNGSILDVDNNYQLNDNLTWVVNKHELRIGGEIQLPQQNITDFSGLQGTWNFGGGLTNIGNGVNTQQVLGIQNAQTGFGIAQLLLGYPDTVSIAGNNIPYQYRWKYFAGYLQDNYRLNPRLTVNLGLRYQVEVPRSEKHHNQGTYVAAPSTTSDGIPSFGYIQLNGLGGYRSTILPIKYNNFEPRIGFAYRVADAPITVVIRSAYGIVHEPTTGLFMNALPDLSPRSSSLAAQGGQNGQWVNLAFNPAVLPPALPAWPSNGKFSDLTLINPAGLVTLPNDWETPYLQQWNAGLGFDFTHNWGLQVNYVGSKGTNLFGPYQVSNLQDFNQYQSAFLAKQNLTTQINNPYGVHDINGNIYQITTGDLLRQNPLIGAVANPFTQGYNSSYNGLQMQLVKRYSIGLQFTLSYTWSKSIDDASCQGQSCSFAYSGFGGATFRQLANGNRQIERSVSSYDIPHNLSLSHNWDLPFGHGQYLLKNTPGWLNQIVGGWKLGGIYTIRSGQPWVVNVGTGAAGNAGFPAEYGNIRPNIVTGCEYVNPSWANIRGTSNTANYLNPSCFTPPDRFTVGNAPRTLPYLRYPLFWSYDLSLLKDFTIHEDIRLQLRAEFYNAFNHANFQGNPNNPNLYSTLDYTNYASPPVTASSINTAWSVTSNNTGPNRTIQLALKVIF